MPRQKGPARELKYPVRTLLDKDGLAHFNYSCSVLKVPQSEALRHAVELQYLTLLSQMSTDATIQPSGQE